MPLILDHINYKYSPGTTFEKHALKDVNLVFQDGEFVGLIGHTGSGKSTLIQHLNGLLKATDGTIYFNGADIYDSDYKMLHLRSKVGLVFQYPEHQLFETTVLQDVQFGPKNLGLSKIEVELRSLEALKIVGIDEDLMDASPFELSGGQKRRVAIAGVLAMQPEVLVLDEPTAGLDPCGRDEILSQIAKIHKERKITVILVSHSMEEIANYVDRLVVMNRGEVFLEGKPRDVFQRYKELEDIGLAAPQVTYLLQELYKSGFEIDRTKITLEEAKQELLRWWNKKEGGKL